MKYWSILTIRSLVGLEEMLRAGHRCSQWNMFHRTHNESPRTNNSVEGWHRSFQANVSSCYPVFNRFIELLKRAEAITWW